MGLFSSTKLAKIAKVTPRLERRRTIKASGVILGLDASTAHACRSRKARKRALIAQARGEGWRGSTYRSAKQFTRRLDREARERAATRRLAQFTPTGV